VAVSLNGPVYASANSGGNWYACSVPGVTTNLFAVTSSAGAEKWVTCAYDGGGVYTSTNHGSTWTTGNAPNTNWIGVTIAADGNRMAGVVLYGGIYSAYADPLPKLNLSRAGTNLTTSWIVPSTNLILQQSSDLTTWSTITNAPVLSLTNLQNQVTLPLSSSNLFCRLKTL
jgi:hypothetical protein